DSKIQTPHLDAMIQNGIHFTDAHSGSAVCTPTRYGILTGRYAWRTSMKEGVTWSWSPPLIDKKRSTVASKLQKKGYHTACIGKWHLGLGWVKDSLDRVDIRKALTEGPNDNGFDYFFGITASLDIPPYIYIENDRSTTQIIDTIEKRGGKEFWRKGAIGNDFKHIEVLPKITEKAVEYISTQATGEKPFFLYFPLPAPHTPILPSEKFQNQSNTNAYGDFVLMVDDVVGQIEAAVKAAGISENTLIIFSSDNGCSPMADFEELAEVGHDPSYVFRGHKADIFEGGMRVPFIAKWPASIPSGISSDEIICHTDLMATLAKITQDSLLPNEGEDSYDMLAVLRGEKMETPIREATVHHSVNGSFSIRQGKWKLIFCPGSGGWSDPRPAKAKELELPLLQLYDLTQDIAEENNLIKDHPKLAKKMADVMKSYIERGRSTPGPDQSNDTETMLYLHSQVPEDFYFD
ncbi:MAG: arylsulfatase, partial [Bacteroidota bacterium]